MGKFNLKDQLAGIAALIAAIVAIGGGTIGDLAGLIASTVLRGINYTLIPTTLLTPKKKLK